MKASVLYAAKRLIAADICIVGHGLPGCVLFTALRQNPHTKGLKIVLLDKDPLPAANDTAIDCTNELRTVSLTQTSTRILDRLLMRPHPEMASSHTFIDSCHTHRFRQITVRDMNANVFSIPTTGCIAGLHKLWTNAWGSVRAHENSLEDQILCGNIDALETSAESGNTLVHMKPSEPGALPYAIEAKLLVGSDGLKSTVRQSVNTRCLSMDYNQKRAYVFCVRIDEASIGCGTHQQTTSYQNFLDDGSIVAFLPTGKSSANIVLSASMALGESIENIVTSHAKTMPRSIQDSLLELLNGILHQRAPGDIPRLVEILADTTPRLKGLHVASFPLALNVALQPFSMGRALIGDAARSIHPLAGQGLNLGIADSAVLFDCILEVVRGGGSLSTEVGGLYGRRMRRHTWPMIVSTELVSSAFSSRNYWMNAVRKYGCGLVNDSPMLQRVFSDFASGQYISSSLAR